MDELTYTIESAFDALGGEYVQGDPMPTTGLSREQVEAFFRRLEEQGRPTGRYAVNRSDGVCFGWHARSWGGSELVQL